MDVVTLGDFTLGRGTFEPGWRWSEDVKPIAGTSSCMTRHTGICVSGQHDRAHRRRHGVDLRRPAMSFVMEPGHDAWTVGDVACVMYDTGIAAYGKAWPDPAAGGLGPRGVDRGHAARPGARACLR